MLYVQVTHIRATERLRYHFHVCTVTREHFELLSAQKRHSETTETRRTVGGESTTRIQRENTEGPKTIRNTHHLLACWV